MTYEEAIKLFKDRDLVGRKIFIDEAIDLAIEVLEKQIPKKPICKIYKSENIYLGTTKTYYCPGCNSIVWLSDKHCPECGQAIDWSNE